MFLLSVSLLLSQIQFPYLEKNGLPLALLQPPIFGGDISDCPRMGEWDQECHQMSQYLCGETLS